MSPQDGERVRASLLAQIERAEQLLATLAEERESLAGRSLEGITRNAADKERLAQELDELAAAHRRLPALPRDAAEGPTTGTLGALDARLRELLSTCREHNRANGARVELLHRYARRAVDVLLGLSNSATVYDPSGQARSTARSRYSTSA